MNRYLKSAIQLLLLFTTLTLVASAQPPPSTACPQVTGDQVIHNLVQRNLERASALPAFRSTRIYRLEYKGFPGSRSAEMIVDMEYGPPNTKSFSIRSQTGSKLVIDRVFKKLLESEKEAFEAENQKRTALNTDNYTFTLLGCEKVADSLMFVFGVEPKVSTKFLYRGKIWVDAADFAVSRISAEPAKSPSFWIKQTQIEQVYGKVKDFWLPARNRSLTTVRLGGHADLSIEYKDYQMTDHRTPPASGNVAGNSPR